MKHLAHIALNDFKLIFRTPSVRTFLALPLLLYALVVWLLPYLMDKYDILAPYLVVFMVIAVVENTQTFCFISSMVLIEEKETGVAKVYGVIPLSKTSFILARLAIPYLITVLLNVVLLIIQPFYTISPLSIVLISLLAGLIVPVYVLGINSIVKNRVQGMVYVKLFNIIVLVPIAAFFIPSQYSPIFSLLPTHWLYQAINNELNNSSILFNTLIGFIFLSALLVVVTRLFFKKHYL